MRVEAEDASGVVAENCGGSSSGVLSTISSTCATYCEHEKGVTRLRHPEFLFPAHLSSRQHLSQWAWPSAPSCPAQSAWQFTPEDILTEKNGQRGGPWPRLVHPDRRFPLASEIVPPQRCTADFCERCLAFPYPLQDALTLTFDEHMAPAQGRCHGLRDRRRVWRSYGLREGDSVRAGGILGQGLVLRQGHVHLRGHSFGQGHFPLKGHILG